jgi:hypothetical protein
MLDIALFLFRNTPIFALNAPSLSVRLSSEPWKRLHVDLDQIAQRFLYTRTIIENPLVDFIVVGTAERIFIHV